MVHDKNSNSSYKADTTMLCTVVNIVIVIVIIIITIIIPINYLL